MAIIGPLLAFFDHHWLPGGWAIAKILSLRERVWGDSVESVKSVESVEGEVVRDIAKIVWRESMIRVWRDIVESVEREWKKSVESLERWC